MTVSELVALGRERGYVTIAEILDSLPDELTDPDQINDILQLIRDMGIKVKN